MRNRFKESYDPTDDVFNRGLAVTMSLDDFITMIDNKGIDLGKYVCSAYLGKNIVKSFVRKGEGNVDSIAVQVLDKNSSIVIESEYIKEVRSVIFSKNVLSADFVAEEGSVLTIWWEL